MRATQNLGDLENVLVAYDNQVQRTPNFKYLHVLNGLFEAVIATGEHLSGLQKHVDALTSIRDKLKELVGFSKESKVNIYDMSKNLDKLTGEPATRRRELAKEMYKLHANYISGLGELPVVDAAESTKAIKNGNFNFEEAKILN